MIYEDSILRKQIHDQIDAESDDQKRLIDEEAAKSHAFVDSAPAQLLRALAHSRVVQVRYSLSPDPSVEQNGNGASEVRFAIKDDVSEIVGEFDDVTPITSILVYEELLKRKPETEAATPAKLKARISMALSRLVEDGVLVQIRKGGGNIPHVYQQVRLNTPRPKPVTMNHEDLLNTF